MYVVPSETFRGRDPISIARAGVTLAYGLVKAIMMMRKRQAIGRGRLRRLSVGAAGARGELDENPDLLHEQNAVMGRANRFLAAALARSRPALPA